MKKAPNIKKKQRDKNCEGKGLLKKDDAGGEVPTLQRHRQSQVAERTHRFRYPTGSGSQQRFADPHDFPDSPRMMPRM
ncbi:hypothetical protein ACVWZ4_003794 [Bradyrhizobium sp. USDA 4472]